MFSKNDLQNFTSYQSNGIEMRGAWHMPHFLNKLGYDETTLEGVQKLLDKVKDAGYNTIFIETVNAYTIYESSVSTIKPSFAGNYYNEEYQDDYLKCFIGESHKRGLKVHAWTTTMRAGKFEESLEKSLPASIKPEWLARGYHGEYGLDGRYGELMWIDPSNPEVVEYLIKHYQELVSNYDLDGVELDAIRYPISNLYKCYNKEEISDFGYTDSAIKEFCQKYQFNGDFKEDIVNNDDLKKQWIEYRSNLITNIVEKIRDAVLKIKPDMPFSAAVFVDPENAVNTVSQNWKLWLLQGWLDFVSPMAYTTDLDLVKTSYLQTEAIANNTAYNLQGIAAIIIEGGNYLHHYEQMNLLNQMSGLGSILFSFRQLLQDDKTLEMVKYVYQNNPAVSPLDDVEDLLVFMIPLIKRTTDNQQVIRLLDEIDNNNYLQQLKKSQDLNVDNRYLNALIKTLDIKGNRQKIINNLKNKS